MNLKHQMQKHPISYKKRSTTRRGQALVEFALLLPLMILILIGATDLGRAFQAYIAVINASREGARQGAINPENQDLMIAAAVQEAQDYDISISTSDVTVTCSSTPCPQYQPIRVEVCYDFQLILRAFISQPIAICRYTEMMAK